MRTLTLEQLKELNPCIEGFKWYSQNIKTENINEILPILANHRWDWCRWLFVRLLSDKQSRQLAIYCAELLLPIFEEKYPYDTRPRDAFEAARRYFAGEVTIEELRVKRRSAAYSAAAAAAYAAADATYATYAATAVAAAAAAADAVAADAAAAYAYAAADASYAAAEVKQQIVDKVIDLLKEMEK